MAPPTGNEKVHRIENPLSRALVPALSARYPVSVSHYTWLEKNEFLFSLRKTNQLLIKLLAIAVMSERD